MWPAAKRAYVDLMNREAKRLGMNNTHFANPVGCRTRTLQQRVRSGLAGRGHRADYPQPPPLCRCSDCADYTFNNRRPANRNRLLWIDPYATA